MTQLEAFTCSGSHMLEIHTHTNLHTLYFTPQLELNWLLTDHRVQMSYRFSNYLPIFFQSIKG